MPPAGVSAAPPLSRSSAAPVGRSSATVPFLGHATPCVGEARRRLTGRRRAAAQRRAERAQPTLPGPPAAALAAVPVCCPPPHHHHHCCCCLPRRSGLRGGLSWPARPSSARVAESESETRHCPRYAAAGGEGTARAPRASLHSHDCAAAAGITYLRLELWDKNDLVSDEQMGAFSLPPSLSLSLSHSPLSPTLCPASPLSLCLFSLSLSVLSLFLILVLSLSLSFSLSLSL